MSSTTDLLNSILLSEGGVTLAELLRTHPHIARRTAQRLIAKLIKRGEILAMGEGRARRYVGTGIGDSIRAEGHSQPTHVDNFPDFIPLSADSRDILAYVDRPVEARKPVGYQRDFLHAYQPNATWYLSESLGFYPVNTDTSKKRHTMPKECLCRREEDTAQNSSVKP